MMLASSSVTLVEDRPRRGHIHLIPSSPPSVASSSFSSSRTPHKPPRKRKTTVDEPYIPSLPPLSVLQTWVHRPQAVAKCTVSDVYRMRSITPAEEAGTSYGTRDLFLLDHFPCRSVELVGWVAGVDHKESSMTLYLDDGDGEHVLPVILKLSLVTIVPPASSSAALTPPSKGNEASRSTKTFVSARERKAQRRQAALADAASTAAKRAPIKVYERKDVRVGDVVRIVGKVEEWQRRNSEGVQWVRQVVVTDAAGGSLSVVDPDEQYHHLAQVTRLHRTLYSKSFELPPTPVPQPSRSLATSPAKSYRGVDFSDSMMPSSELGSEADYDESVAALRDPSKLHPKQLTETTFRQYMLDHMTQSILAAVKLLSINELRLTLSATFPEYRASLAYVKSSGDTPSSGPRHAASQPHEVLSVSARDNLSRSSSSTSSMTVNDADATPTPKRFRSKAERLAMASAHTPQSTTHAATRPRESAAPLESYSVELILATPTLAKLSGLVVDAESRRAEKRRRKRLAEGSASQADLSVEASAYKLSPARRDRRSRKLVQHVIRQLSEEGSLVACADPRDGGEGYLTLPPELLGPLLLVFMEEQRLRERRTFGRKGEKRGMWNVDKVCRRLASWGQEGRWERVGRWAVEDAMRWAEARGFMSRQEGGWVLSDNTDVLS